VPGFVPVLLAAGIWLGVYNKAVTGNPLRMPYMVYEQTYGSSPLFLWQKLQPMPEFRHKQLELFAKWGRDYFESQQTVQGFFRVLFLGKARGCLYQWSGYWLLLLPLVFALGACRKRVELKVAFAVAASFFLVETMATWMLPHYLAAAFGLFVFLCVAGLQEMSRMKWLRRFPPGNGLLPVGLFIVICVSAGVSIKILSFARRHSPDKWHMNKVAMVDRLRKIPGEDLVIVSYEKDANPHQEWVYNEADIDHSSVVFARSMADNSELLNYFKNRVVWHLTISEKNQILTRVP
jgi:hypothetical protein